MRRETCRSFFSAFNASVSRLMSLSLTRSSYTCIHECDTHTRTHARRPHTQYKHTRSTRTRTRTRKRITYAYTQHTHTHTYTQHAHAHTHTHTHTRTHTHAHTFTLPAPVLAPNLLHRAGPAVRMSLGLGLHFSLTNADQNSIAKKHAIFEKAMLKQIENCTGGGCAGSYTRHAHISNSENLKKCFCAPAAAT